MRTETAERVLEQARQILQMEKDGHSPTQDRLDWARSILHANALWTKRTDAHALLNAAQAGQCVPLHRINEALTATGDLLPVARTYAKEPA